MPPGFCDVRLKPQFTILTSLCSDSLDFLILRLVLHMAAAGGVLLLEQLHRG